MHTLRAVQVARDPLLLLHFQGWGGRSWPTAVYVPIPADHEAAAVALIARFQQEILGPATPSAARPSPLGAPPAPEPMPRPEPPMPQAWVGGRADTSRYGAPDPARRSDSDGARNDQA